MRYRYTFSVNLFDQEKTLDFKEGLDKINSDYVLKDHGLYGYRFLTGKIWDFETYNKLICLSEKLNVKTSSVALTEHYVKYVDLEYDPQDRLCADYLEIGTKTEYDSEEYLNEFKNGDLYIEKKSLGNFKNFQLNFLDDADCLVFFAKKRFCSFLKENNIFNINFKPVMVKSVTGKISPSTTIFWAIPEQVFEEGREIFRDSSFDKYHHPIPKSISPKFRDRIEKIDLFFVNEYSCIISQNLYHLIQEAELNDDISGATPWDVGYFGGEASSKLKQKLIEQGCFDEAFEE